MDDCQRRNTEPCEKFNLSPDAATPPALLLATTLLTRFLVMCMPFVILQHTALLQLLLKSLQCAVQRFVRTYLYLCQNSKPPSWRVATLYGYIIPQGVVIPCFYIKILTENRSKSQGHGS